MRTLVIGLGSMGFGAAVSCVRAGIQTTGFDVNPDALERFQAQGGQSIHSLDACAGIDCVLIFVVNAAQAESVLFESDLLSKLNPNALVINCVTLAPSKAIEIATNVKGFGFRYIDAPVSGGAAKALDGRMSIMASGAPHAMRDAKPVFDAISEHVFELGDDPGQVTNEISKPTTCWSSYRRSRRSHEPSSSLDMDLHQVIAISKCAGSSWMFENRAPHIADGIILPSSVNIFVKDLGIVTDEASRHQAVTHSLTQHYPCTKRHRVRSGSEDDSVIKILPNNQISPPRSNP